VRIFQEPAAWQIRLAGTSYPKLTIQCSSYIVSERPQTPRPVTATPYAAGTALIDSLSLRILDIFDGREELLRKI
jgi:hypothetical protein